MSARRLTGSTFAALSVRNFRLYFIGQLISVSGTWMQSVAQGWLILQMTGSSVGLGVAVALQYVPMLLLGFYGGLVVDRHEKRRILYVTQSSAGVLALGLAILVGTGHVRVDEVYGFALLLGIVNLFDTPARQAFVQEMVGRDLITNAVSLNSVLMNAGRVIGPSVAAIFIAVAGMASSFYANAASFGAVIVALAMMRGEDFVPMATVERARGQIMVGLRYVMQTVLVRDVVLAVAVVGTFAFNFTVTLPLLARTTFHQHSAAQYGLLMSAMGVGAVLGGLFVARRSRATARLLAILSLGFGVFMVLVALAPSLWWAAIALVPTGAFSIAFAATANATLQLNSSPEMRGRVMSLYGTAFLGTTPIGSLAIGALVGATNPRIGLLVGAVLTVLVGAWLVSVRSRREAPVSELVESYAG